MKPRTAHSQRRVNLLLTIPFLLLFYVQLAHHQLWRDELNAFALAAASPTLPVLFHNLHYEGHPWLWYALLWVVAKLTSSPVGMKLLEAAIGTSSLLLIGVASPFSSREKLLLLAGYYVTFEYTVMSRMYGVMLLLTLLYVGRRAKHPSGVLGLALLLGLLASTDMTGLVLSGALAAEYVYAEGPGVPRLGWATTLYVGLLGLAVWSAWPSAEASWRTTARPFSAAASGMHLVRAALDYLVGPYLPVGNLRLQPFWFDGPDPRLLLFGLPLVLGLYWFSVGRERSLRLLMAVALVAGVAFGHLVYLGSLRHWGLTFLAFLAAIWLLRSKGNALPGAALVLLGLSAAGGLLANAEQWRRPFSNAEATARWLREQHLESAPLAGSPDTSTVSLAPLLGRPVYLLDCRCNSTFVQFSRRRDDFTVAQIPERLVEAQRALKVDDFLYVGTLAFTPAQAAELKMRGLSLAELQSFTGAEAQEEDFWIYRIGSARPEAQANGRGW